ncbi:MAG: rhodanese-like domain-containing protein [Pirellulaceae bacterium]
MRYHLLVVSLASLLCVCLSDGLQAAEHTKESIAAVKKNVAEDKAVLIDVREQREWDAGHLAQAKLKPLSILAARNGDPTELLRDVPKDKIIYCHCKSGGRALIACDVLKDLGFDVRALKPGFVDLVEAGFEKSKDAE